MAEKEDKEPAEAQKYKKEAAQIKKEISEAAKQTEPYVLHMQARHIESIHALYKEKLGYNGVGDLESMNEFKHNYFNDKNNHDEVVDFLTDFHVHRAVLTYDIIKGTKPLHKLDATEYNSLLQKAKTKAAQLRKEDKGLYNTLLKEYAKITSNKLRKTLQEHQSNFIQAYTQQLLPEALQQQHYDRLDIELSDVIKKIKPQHEHYDPELKNTFQKIKQEKQQLAYMRAMEDEDIDPEHYQLPQRRMLEQAQAQPSGRDAKPAGQVAPTPGAPGPGGA